MGSEKIIRALVIEDEPIICKNIVKKINQAQRGFKVIGSQSNGYNALQVLDDLNPDVIFTDIRMPVMDGLEFIRKVREINAKIPVVIITGHTDFEYAQKAIGMDVTEYLLKPLKMESLQVTLEKIKKKLIENQTSQEELFYHALHMPAIPAYYTDDTEYTVYLLHAGNLSFNYVNSLPEMEKFFRELWNTVDWKHLLEEECTLTSPWWLIHSSRFNQKYLIVKDENTDNCPFISEKLLKSQKKALFPVPLTISVHAQALRLSDMGEYAFKLKQMVNQGLLFGRSQILNEGIPHDELHRTVFEKDLESKISLYAKTKKKELLKNQLTLIFKKWDLESTPQVWVERTIHELLKILQSELPNITESQWNIMEMMLYYDIAKATSAEYVFIHFWNRLDYAIPNDDYISSESLVNDIMHYLQNNYQRSIELSDLTQRFNISPSYLMTIFKKKTGITPINFLIQNRIQRAKKMIEDDPSIDIKTVGELVGYEDQHYFSRIFKKITGLSPSHYKE
jgi:two-component system response regulator YesN